LTCKKTNFQHLFQILLKKGIF